MTLALTPVDALGEALHILRMSGTFYSRSELSAPWGLEMPPFKDCLMLHVVTAGQCWVEVEGAESQLLRPGDLCLVPHGAGHRLLSAPGVPAAKLFDLKREEWTERYEFIRHGGGGEKTSLICSVVEFDHPAAHQLVQLLPKLITVGAMWASPEMEWVQSTLRFMASEARAVHPGGETVITRLADILVIQAIRSWMASDAAAKTGWLGALQHPQIGRAIAALHRHPARPWTVASLASEANMSRSAFAARFAEIVGEAPMQYASRWRMHTALTMLKEKDAKLGDVAHRLGYQSEAAFSRTFKRFIGVSPGAIRRDAV